MQAFEREVIYEYISRRHNLTVENVCGTKLQPMFANIAPRITKTKFVS